MEALGNLGVCSTYSEVLQVIDCEAETGKVEESILEHASVAVAVRLVSYRDFTADFSIHPRLQN